MKRMLATLLAIGAAIGASVALPAMERPTTYASASSCDDECQWHDEHNTAYQGHKGHGGSGHRGGGGGVRDRKFSA